MKNITLAVLLFILTAGITFSQSKSVGTITQTQNIAPDGTNNYSAQSISPELQNLYKELKQAKNEGNLSNIKLIQNQINNLSGSAQPNITHITNVASSQSSEGDNFNFTAINSTHPVNSGAIATDRITGYIYAAYTRYMVGESDEMWFYKSTNNGLTWNSFYHFSFPEYTELDYNPNELDIEVINRGDSAFIWGTAGVSVTGTFSSALIFRMRADGAGFNSGVLNTEELSINYRFPRMTSDASRYTTGAFVYFMYTQDSLGAGNNKYLKSKYLYISNPFDTEPNIHELGNSPNGAYFYYTSSAAGDSCYMQNDIAYVNTPGDSDLVVTATVVRGNFAFAGQSIYFTTSSNYGAAVDYSYNIMDTRYLKAPRISSPGYRSRNLMVAANRLYANGDWDPYYYYSKNYSHNTSNFLQSGYLDNTADTCYTVDVKARPRSTDNFLFAIANKVQSYDSKAYVLGLPFKAGVFQSVYVANPTGNFGTGNFAAPVAGFRNVNNDSCIIGWQYASGMGYNVTGGQSGTMTGTGNNSTTPDNFSLGQNYPNPFNPTTKISFTIQQNSFAKLTIYDIMGREITKLVDGQLNAGVHSVDFNASALPSGVYYYKLEANGFSDVKKMMLVK
ncbi:MAG: T9SS type A sorting domain-containing protein [Bacteroidetes bacterium]|nr:T9SS type A sorting domain-containing protein [Bacteroidota bacterium]